MKVSLRGKSIFALGICIIIVLALAAAVAYRGVQVITRNLGSAYARNAAQYNKQRLLTPVLREMALAERLADSEVTRRWLRNEDSAEARSMFFAEAERYRLAFAGHSFFVASLESRHYYFSDGKDARETTPRYTLKRGTAEDGWFFNTIEHGKTTNLNVDPNHHLGVTNVWFNIKVTDRGRTVGLIGTGMNLATFLKRFITDHGAGVTPMIVDRDGAIQAHPDPTRIDYGSINNKGHAGNTLFSLLAGQKDRDAARVALSDAVHTPDQSRLFWAKMGGSRQLFAVSFIPELGWNVVTAVDLKAARLLDPRIFGVLVAAGAGLLMLLGVFLVVAMNRILLRPLERLTASARSMAAGDYAVSLPQAGGDEIGDLTRAFGAMASRVCEHMEELEGTVRRRTAELQDTNDTLALANRTVAESIRYAGVIQSAILPDRELERALPDGHFVLWRPRDIVGGDFHVFRDAPGGMLMGVVDCAGHGVPGALMTMAAHAALSAALESLGPADPAALLHEIDRRVRSSMPSANQAAGLAAHMDAGFAWFDAARAEVVFAGARIALHWSDGNLVEELAATPVSIGGRRVGRFENRVRPIPESGTFYLTTDGLLDQSGGPKGFGYGNRRFNALMRRAAGLEPREQLALFESELDAWRKDGAQRDDITVLALTTSGFAYILRNMDGSYGHLSVAGDLQRAADTVVL